MKKGLKKILSFFLAASVLFSSTGVVIASHVCLKKGESDVSLFENKSCCAKYHKSCSSIPVVKKKCCQLTVSYHKLEVNTSVKTSAAQQIVSIPVIDSVVPLPASFLVQNTASHSEFPPGNLRLEPGTKNFLYSIRLLLI